MEPFDSVRRDVWLEYIKKNAFSVVAGGSSVYFGSLLLEPFILAERHRPSLSQFTSHMTSLYNLSSLFDYKLRINAWTTSQSQVDLKRMRLMKALAKLRYGSSILLLSTWTWSGVNVYYARYHEYRQLQSLGRVSVPVNTAVNKGLLTMRLSPTLPHAAHSWQEKDVVRYCGPIWVKTSVPSLPPYPTSPYLDSSLAPRILSQSIAKYYYQQYLLSLSFLSRFYEQILVYLYGHVSFCIPQGKLFLQSYDANPSAQAPNDLNKAISFAMHLLSDIYAVINPSAKSLSQTITCFHLHVHWRDMSHALYADSNLCIIQPSPSDLFQQYISTVMDINTSLQTKSLALNDWQEKIYQHFLHSYESQLISYSPSKGIHGEYLLYQVDGRPFLLYSITKQLMQTYTLHQRGIMVNGHVASRRKQDRQPTESNQNPLLYAIDSTLGVVEAVGRAVRSGIYSFVDAFTSPFATESDSVKIRVFVDQESSEVKFSNNKVNFPPSIVGEKNIADYLCQGLSSAGMQVLAQSADESEVQDAVKRHDMPVILTIGHSLPWLYYRIQVLCQRYPDATILAVHVHNHQEELQDGREDVLLPTNVHLFSTEEVQEELWSLFHKHLTQQWAR